ncbi:MAG: mechanosensitive ion channel family protein [Bacteroidales bacterium]|jgi:small conductance mechanosensitive channel|nr:mechanosensitive ion channel family protein [Bacteroidales bacterium]OJX91641.1 MAG: potassium transporter KefA [Paludibacter sp. 47-17]
MDELVVKEKLVAWVDSLVPWFLSSGLKIFFIAVAAIVLNKVVSKIIEKAIRIAVVSHHYSSRDAEVKRENTLIQIFTITFRSLLFIVAGLMILKEFGIDIAPMIAAAGIAGLALGFGGQYLIRDIITGLFIILENQYRIGDVVNFDGLGGAVEEITLRKTTLRDMNGTVHHIPHGEIKRVSNLSKDFARVNMDVGVAYDSDLDQVIAVVNETGTRMANDERWKDAFIKPIQFVRVDSFGESAILVKVVGETHVLRQWEVAGEFRKRLKAAFDKAGIVIPFPQTDIHIHKMPGVPS